MRHEGLVFLEHREIQATRLSVPHWDGLANGDGMVRWRGRAAFEKCETALKPHKKPVEVHLRGLHLLDEQGCPTRPVLCIGNRNLGNNIGFVAWEAGPIGRLLRLQSEPLERRTYGCLCCDRDDRLSIRTLSFRKGKPRSARWTDLSHELKWCASGMRILEEGRIRRVPELAEDAYDIRHLLALDGTRDADREVLQRIYGDPAGPFDFDGFKTRAIEEWRVGRARSRYFHNCIGVSGTGVVLLMAEGTPEQLAERLQSAGCEDALILDQGGSVGLWAWWVLRAEDRAKDKSAPPRGGFLLAAPDYRPAGTSMLAFVLDGPTQASLPGGQRVDYGGLTLGAAAKGASAAPLGDTAMEPIQRVHACPEWWNRDMAAVEKGWADLRRARFGGGEAALLDRATSFARDHHAAQRRSGGEPYAIHPYRVAMSAVLEFDQTSLDLLVAALLHDVLEDSTACDKDIADAFGRGVAGLVRAMTRPTSHSRPGDTFGSRYFQDLIAAGPHCVLLKILDKLDNLRDSPGHPSKDKQRKWTRETYEAYFLLLPYLEEDMLRRRAAGLLESALELHDRDVYDPHQCIRHYVSKLRDLFDLQPNGSSRRSEDLARGIYRLPACLDAFLSINSGLGHWLVDDGVRVVKTCMSPCELAATLASRICQQISRGEHASLAALAGLPSVFGEADRRDLWRPVTGHMEVLGKVLFRPDTPGWLAPIGTDAPHLLCAVHSRLLLPAIRAFPEWQALEGLIPARDNGTYRDVLEPAEAARWQDRLNLNLEDRGALWRWHHGIGSTVRADRVLRSILSVSESSPDELPRLLAMRLLSEYSDATCGSAAPGRDLK